MRLILLGCEKFGAEVISLYVLGKLILFATKIAVPIGLSRTVLSKLT